MFLSNCYFPNVLQHELQGLGMFPFFFLLHPQINKLLTHSTPTGYTSRGSQADVTLIDGVDVSINPAAICSKDWGPWNGTSQSWDPNDRPEPTLRSLHMFSLVKFVKYFAIFTWRTLKERIWTGTCVISWENSRGREGAWRELQSLAFQHDSFESFLQDHLNETLPPLQELHELSPVSPDSHFKLHSLRAKSKTCHFPYVDLHYALLQHEGRRERHRAFRVHAEGQDITQHEDYVESSWLIQNLDESRYHVESKWI